ncbi:MAG: peptidoglycan-associated lipoprotein Pal [Pseudomonadota bacterium]
MKISSKAVLILGALSLAACTDAGRLGWPGRGGDDAAGGAGVAGSISDPTSPAFFQETVGDRVLFPVDQSDLTDGARATLNAQASWLQDNPAYNAVIEGHADEQGTGAYNIALGARRADEVRSYLISRGIADTRLTTISYGKERPLAICSDESCYAQNRRAVTVLATGGTS